MGVKMMSHPLSRRLRVLKTLLVRSLNHPPLDPEDPGPTKTRTMTVTTTVVVTDPVDPKPIDSGITGPDPEEPDGLSTLTFSIRFVRRTIVDFGPYSNPNVLDFTQTVSTPAHGDQVVFSSCKITGNCSTDTVFFEYLGEDFEIDPSLPLFMSQRRHFRQSYLSLSDDIHLVSISASNLFQEGVLDCSDVAVPMIIAAPNDLDRDIPSNFSDDEQLECVYSSGKVLYVSGWIWKNSVPSLSSRAFTACDGFVLWCVRDLAWIDESPYWNDDIPSSTQGLSGPTLYGNSFAAPRVGALTDWMRLWFDVEDTRTGTLQVFALIRAFAEDLGDEGIDCAWGMGRVDADFFAPPHNPENLSGGGRLLEEYQLKNRRPLTISTLSARLEEKGFTGTFKEQLAKLEWRYRNGDNATDSDKEGYGSVLEFPDCSD